jgi:predicted metal-dependent hydrolase
MTPEEERDYLEKKIEQIKQDIEMFRQQGNADKKLEVMMFYQEYIKEELKTSIAKLNRINNGSTE